MLPEVYNKLVVQRSATRLRDAVALVQAPIPEPKSNEVLVRNHYAGVNGIYDHRLALGQIEPEFGTHPFDFGFESIGHVVGVGKDVSSLRVGDGVASVKFGHAYCEYHCIDAREAIAVDEVSPEVLTLIPTGTSALVALEQVGELRSGERVLITAAAGGLGHIATQVALQRENEVTAVCGSVEKARRLAALGCHHVINYRQDNLDEALSRISETGFDLILETVGGTVFDTAVHHLANHGRLVVSGFTSDADNPKPVHQTRIYTQLYWKAASVRAFMNPLFREYQADARQRLVGQYREGKLDIWVNDPIFEGLERLPDAVEYLLSGKNLGKVILKIA